jgi:hypothetical protein
MSANPVRTSSPAAARVHSVVEVARLVLKKRVSRCRTAVRMSAKGPGRVKTAGREVSNERGVSAVAIAEVVMFQPLW